MKKFILIALMIMFSAFISCEGGNGSDKKTTIPDTPAVPDTPVVYPEKVYTINPIASAEFYYCTAAKVIYAYNSGCLKIIHLTATVAQEGHENTTENIVPVDFYKLGDYLNFELVINGKTRYFEQLYGNMTEVEALWRRPDTVNVTMNNGRFSIEKNTWTTYTVSDIRNLTGKSGICRTLLCQAYYVGKYQSYYDYGLWFCAQDDSMTATRSGLYFWAESESSNAFKIIDEPGEMWAFN